MERAREEDSISTRGKVLGIATAALLALVSVTRADDAASDARQAIARLDDALVDVLRQSNELGYKGRFAKLAPILEGAFDLQYMARMAVGRSWLKLSDEQKARWYELFETYMTANYASRFDHWSGQKFEVLGEEPGAAGTVLVRTKVIDPQQENVELSYRLRKSDGGWKVVDVYLKGTVSELALRRSEYAAVLKRDGFDALAASVQQKIDELAAGHAAPP
jgi:phospholipid transport system substrate-binding protein